MCTGKASGDTSFKDTDAHNLPQNTSSHSLRSSLKIVFPDSTCRDLEIEMLSDEHVLRKVVAFLEQAQGVNQLIVTTHESSLLDLDLLRRDEIWFVEKDRDGGSRLYSLEEFTPRYDLDIRRGYLQGRVGSIPVPGEPAPLYSTGKDRGEENAGET